MSSRPQIRPLDPPLTPIAAAGIALWALAGVATLLFDSPAGWTEICIAGVVLGIPGLLAMVVHDRKRAHRRTEEITAR